MYKLTLALALSVSWVPAAVAGDLAVTVTGVEHAEGDLQIDLYQDKRTYKKKLGKGGGVYTARVPAAAGSVTIVIEDVAPGRYAGALFHDEDGDGKLDKNFVGMPREGVGASNNVKGSFGPPSFDKMLFEMAEVDTAIEIKMDY